jgi:LPS sulfotransferase NodH
MYLKLFGHRNYNRFAIIGNARTGSDYLYLGLNSSNCVRMHHEVFAEHHLEMAGKGFDQIFSMLFGKQNKNIKAVGFKLFYDHFTKDEWEKFLSYNDFKIIHLTREDCLRTIVSLDIAFKLDYWSTSTEDKGKPIIEKRIWLDTSNLIGRLEQIKDYEALTRCHFKDRHILEVEYNKLTTKPGETFNRIGEYLGVGDIDFGKITVKKQNPENLEQLITNYDEVYQLLENTKFAKYLNS